jgi:uncharacterized protein
MLNSRVLIFLSLILLVYLHCAWILARRLFKIGENPFHSWLNKVVIALGLTGVACFAYGYFVEPYWLDVSRVSVKSRKLGRGETITVAHISDIHSDPKPRAEESLARAVAEERPDLIVYTGDSLNSEKGLPILRSLLSKLSAVAPTYVVKGNWDSHYWSHLNLFGETGVKELTGTPHMFEIKGVEVAINGLPYGSEGQLKESIQHYPNHFSIFLYHTPDLIMKVSEYNVDLYCAGHTHGGQVALPFYGALVTFSNFDKQFESGLHKIKDTWLYVNRGLGMEGGNAPRVRFCARPELTLIKIEGEA